MSTLKKRTDSFGLLSEEGDLMKNSSIITWIVVIAVIFVLIGH